MRGGWKPGDPVWSPAKLYVPNWKIRARYWVLRAFDLVLRGGAAASYLEGPWCKQCHRWWPVHPLASKDVLCPCGATDPLAVKRMEERAGLKPGTGPLLLDNPLGFLGALLVSRLMAPPGAPWWAAFGTDERPETLEDAKRLYKRALRTSHPDRGGSREQMEKVQGAWAKAEKDYARG